MTYVQHPPYAIQVELTEGCQLRCSFCGINGIRHAAPQHDFRFMKVEDADAIAAQIAATGWNARIEFAMHGEPTMNPNYLACLERFRIHLPRHSLLLTTNGGGLCKGDLAANVREVLRVVNTLAIDEYEGISYAQRLRDATVELPHQFDIHRYEYPDDPRGNPHRRSRERRLVFITPINLNRHGTHAYLNTHAGAGAAPPLVPHTTRCAKPFRELSIRWDGAVALCCEDWRGEYPIGRVLRDGLVTVWRAPAFDAARRVLLVGDRASIRPCSKCNHRSYRTGLLPDPMGKVKLPAPTTIDRDTIRAAEETGPLVRPVRRPWESA